MMRAAAAIVSLAVSGALIVVTSACDQDGSKSSNIRYGDCEVDIGRAVAFLVSDDARFVTGQTVMLDGGTTHL